jgi:hypothetical protein
MLDGRADISLKSVDKLNLMPWWLSLEPHSLSPPHACAITGASKVKLFSTHISRQLAELCVLLSCRILNRSAGHLNACNVRKNVLLARITSKGKLPPYGCTPLSRISQCTHMHLSTSATASGKVLPHLYLFRTIRRKPHADINRKMPEASVA